MFTGNSDWGEPESTLRRPKAPAQSVRDDWEDDDELEEIPVEEKNKKIWEKANHNAATPMPAFIVSSSSSSVASPPPAAAFQPALKILKRPTTNENAKSPSPSMSQESLEDREARYEAARKRIFGEETNAASKKDSPIIRNPRGPDDVALGADSPAKGFDRRESQ
ncbi:hypothetical protein BDP27DRAFT_1309747 [Rhodocollybia butyracea]|uniref:SUZ domain-containing protein n=1 Tax=Rhodocollybia butyracea TaxID=206335 RepID=A0A9P5QCV5_9AGAR|nr:hypothetical protein BDP27DRAFT_1309747 [Rhodocollybia butyracea]